MAEGAKPGVVDAGSYSPAAARFRVAERRGGRTRTTNKMAEEGRTPDYTTLVVHRTRCDGKSSFLAFYNSKEWQGQEAKQTTIKTAGNLASHGRLTIPPWHLARLYYRNSPPLGAKLDGSCSLPVSLLLSSTRQWQGKGAGSTRKDGRWRNVETVTWGLVFIR